MNDLNWFWITLAVTVPPLVGVLVAFPFWRTGQVTFGSIVGTAIIFGSAIALILREHVELDRLAQQCIDAGQVCWPVPSAFTRFAIYAFIALIQVFALFFLSLIVDERNRRRNYAPEWQRR
jgi:ABC-type branched-subunit amino acid transport system permease subunit